MIKYGRWVRMTSGLVALMKVQKVIGVGSQVKLGPSQIGLQERILNNLIMPVVVNIIFTFGVNLSGMICLTMVQLAIF